MEGARAAGSADQLDAVWFLDDFTTIWIRGSYTIVQEIYWGKKLWILVTHLIHRILGSAILGSLSFTFVHPLFLSFTFPTSPSTETIGWAKLRLFLFIVNYRSTFLHNLQMHWYLWGVLHLGLSKLFNCNQILGRVADENWIVKIYMFICENMLFFKLFILLSQLKEPFGGSVRGQDVPICGGNPATTRERHIYLSDSHAVDIRIVTGNQQNNPRFLIKYESKLTAGLTELMDIKAQPMDRFNSPLGFLRNSRHFRIGKVWE